ncbi:helix-turn-helix domain-containing protein [Chitinophaga sp. Hz27]|uniref:helix-turn-helix domain-containing protein n=1 Tax=Chitinophaga sp. Hz27 TaxID=3347169 RepID=UPI0035D64B4F
MEKKKNLSQKEFARQLGVHHSIISKYERDEVIPTIDVVKNTANILETTVGFLLGETKKQDVLKDQAMLKRLNDIASLAEEDKQYILYTLDALIKNVKLKQM